MEEEKKKGGVWKWLGIGCGVIIVILIIGIVIIWTQKDKIFSLATGPAKEMVVQALPEDYDKDQARRTFDEFSSKMLKGQLPQDAVQEWGDKFKEIMQDQSVDQQEAVDFMKIMEDALKRTE